MAVTGDEGSVRDRIRAMVRRRYGEAARGAGATAYEGMTACCVPPVGPRAAAREAGLEAEADASPEAMEAEVESAFVRARKPAVPPGAAT